MPKNVLVRALSLCEYTSSAYPGAILSIAATHLGETPLPRYAEPERSLMTECRRCAKEVDSAFRDCPWCAAPLRIKVTELFGGADGKALRVSRYFGDEERSPRSARASGTRSSAGTCARTPRSPSPKTRPSGSPGFSPRSRPRTKHKRCSRGWPSPRAALRSCASGTVFLGRGERMRRSMLRRWHARTGLIALLVTVAAVLAATANAGRTTVLAGAPYSPACGVGTSFFDSLRPAHQRGAGRKAVSPASIRCSRRFRPARRRRLRTSRRRSRSTST